MNDIKIIDLFKNNPYLNEIKNILHFYPILIKIRLISNFILFLFILLKLLYILRFKSFYFNNIVLILLFTFLIIPYIGLIKKKIWPYIYYIISNIIFLILSPIVFIVIYIDANFSDGYIPQQNEGNFIILKLLPFLIIYSIIKIIFYIRYYKKAKCIII